MTGCSLETSGPNGIINYPATPVSFQDFGIDCSCGGKLLKFACREKGLDEQSCCRNFTKF